MSNYPSLVAKISNRTGVLFRGASATDLAKLETLALPKAILEFYAAHEPAKCVEGQVRLWPIQDIVGENSSYAPGCYSVKHGFVVFASTQTGDAYCFDTRRGFEVDPVIVLISHEMITEESTSSDIERLAKPIAQNLEQFLAQFVEGSIDEECRYG